MPREEIVFEDLHGVPDDDGIELEVDLSPDDKGITRVAADPEGDDDEDGDDEKPRIPVARGEKPEPTGDDEDDDAYSKRVRARIERERRATSAERTRADAAEAELARLRKEKTDDRRRNAKDEVDRINTEVTQIETDLELALEGGKTKDAVRLTSRLTDIKARRERLTAQLEDGPDEDPAPTQPAAAVPPKNTRAESWKAKNADWYAQEGTERYTRMAKRIDQELFREGYDPTEADYFEELDKRLRKEAPKFFKDKVEDEELPPDDDGADKGRRRTVAPVRDGARGGRSEGANDMNRIRITARDKEVMRNFGLDPNDPAALKEFAASKRQASEAS